MPRSERPLDEEDSELGRFAADLRKLREKAGAPPYRKLARIAHYSSTTLADAAAGRKLPSLPVTLAYVRACGGETEPWERRWHRLSAELNQTEESTDLAAGGSEDCPYVGLSAFQADDAARFFGRERLTADLESRVRGDRFVAVFGASGSGKSSLLRAGLLPRVSGGPWTTLVLTPGPHPFEECAARLSALTGSSSVALLDDLRTGPRALHLTVLRALAEQPQDAELLIVVDQFEEVFTLCADHEERARFIAALLTAAGAANSRTRVVLGVRADFYGACSQYPDLVDAVQRGQLLVGPMTTDELRRAVSRPAVEAGCTVEGALLARVVADATGQAGVLPLVSHAMRETWRRKRGNALTVSGYEAAGGISHALANTAETVYAGLTDAQQRLARSVFLRLVSLNDGAEDSKRRLARDELDPRTDAVLDALARARLVTLDTDTVEITHEALLHAWPRLRDWIREDRAGLLVQQQLTDAAAAWDREQRDSSALYRGARLTAAREWARDHADDVRLSARVQDFLAASAGHQDRGVRRRRAAVVALCLLTVLAVVAAGLALQQRSAATSERNSAVSGEAQAQAAQLRGTDQSLAARLDVAGYRIRPTRLLSTDLLGTQSAPLSTSLTGHTATVFAVAFSTRGHLMATAGADDTVRLWHVTDATRPTPLGRPVPAGCKGVMWLAISPDGRTLAGAGRDGTVRLWNIADPGHPTAWPAPLRGHSGIVFSVSFGPDGRTLASAGDDGTVRLWNVTDPAHLAELGAPLRGQKGAVASAAYSPDGRTVASAGHDHTIQLWNVTDPAHPAKWGRALRGHTDTVYAVAFSPDSRIMASVGNDFTLRLWDVSDPAQPVPLGKVDQAGADTIYAVAFSPDGKVLATAGADQTVRLWNLTDPNAPLALGPPLTGHTGYVYWLAFSPDGRTLASVGGDRTVRLWDLPRTVLPTPSYENTVAFSPDGRVLAAGSTDGAVRLWNTADPRRPTALGGPLLGNTNAVNHLEFSRNGRLLASAGRDGTVRLWDVTDPARPNRLGTPLGQGTDAVTTAVFSPDGRVLASAGYDDTVRLWDVTDPARPHRIGHPITGHTAPIRTLAFSPDGRTLASAGADDTTRLWNVTDPAHPEQTGPPLNAHAGGVGSVAFSPDGHTLATANDDHTVRLWDVRDPRHPAALAAPLTGHTGFVLSVAFSRDGRTLVSSGSDGTLRLWDVADPAAPAASGGAISGHTGPIDQAVLSPDGRTLASAGDDHTVLLQSLDTGEAVRRVCATTAGTLTRRVWGEYISALPYRQVCD